MNPQPSGVPAFAEMAEQSKWLTGVPGLLDAALGWETALPGVRLELARSARSLARPTLHPEGFSRIGVIAGRVAAAVGRAVGDLPAGVWRRLLYGEEVPSPREHVAHRLQAVVASGGPSLVKLGQFVATARGILPDELVDGFSWCVDSVPPLSGSDVRQVLIGDLGAPPEDLFASFEVAPMAAASIAQTHEAVTFDGRRVVVKVQRPGLRQQFERDLRAMALLAFVLENRSSTVRSANLSGFVDLFARLVLEEVDFRLEACNMVELGLAAEHAGAEFVVFPRPLPGFVTKRVIVMERLEGVPYSQAEWGRIDAGSRERLLRLVIAGVLEHTLIYGVFHGDLHAGNVLAAPDGTLGLVDYGIVGRMDENEREALVRFMIGFAMNDTRAQLESMVGLGAVPPGADLSALAEKLDEVVPKGPVTQERLAEALGAVIRILVAEGFRLPTSLVLFFKNLLYLNGFAAAVAPDVDLMSEIGPIFGYFRDKYGDEMEAIVGAVPLAAAW